MEELAIKEKAKRYDEALEKARSIRFGNPQSGTANTVCEEIFPELKESEDEKVRKEIIDFLKLPHPQFVGKRDHEKWIAWLEKQAKHAKFRDSIQVGDKVTRNEDGMLVNLSQLNRIAKKDEKQGEQKPTIEMKSAEESLGIDSDTYNEIVDECIYGDDKQKPAWSEEDEKFTDAIIQDIRRLIFNSFGNEVKGLYLKEIDWLKSLKQRVGG